jgi:exopolyphosphatase/guanosine-5'-triphosphate,3'-diphosphate pyrophosphatase
MARFAAIDVGSNAMRLRIVEAERPKNDASQLDLVAFTGWREIASQRAPVRLGSEVFLTGKLTHGSISAACAALKEFKNAMEEARVDAYRAVATSAVREASNALTLVERARREAAIELEVIEGVEEARLIELAVVRRLELGPKSALLVDVGGGSTELTMLEGAQHTYSVSLPIGTVRLLEAYKSPRLLGEAVDRALTEALPDVPVPFSALVGTGGNIETLADLCPLPNGARGVDVPAMRALYREMKKMAAPERQKKWNLRPDRADTILPASLIYWRIAQAFGKKSILAPGVGLKEGVIDELVLRHYELWDAEGEAASVLDACTRLGRRYQFDEAHAKTVTGFAAAIFDDMALVHGLGPRERLLLQAAAILHDLGDFVRYEGHHKHTYYLVLHSDIIGLTADERAIVANIARYHRKSLPDKAHSNFRELGPLAKERVRALASILRIADALDREHLGKIRVVRAAVDRDKKRLVLAINGDEGRELEEWTLRAKADLMREVFDLDVVLA